MRSIKVFVNDEVHQDLKLASVLKKETISDIVRKSVEPVLKEARLEMKLQALKETKIPDENQ